MAQTIQKQWETVSGVRFRDTGQGDLDPEEIDKEETDLGDHYLFGEGDDKSDYSFPVVDAEGVLRAQNVLSAWTYRRYAPVSQSEMKDLIQPLNQQFEDPPINFEGGKMKSKIEKHVPIAKADSSRQVAVGVAMEPNAVDLAGDFERPETIERLSEGYMERLSTGESRSGVMHSVFPDTETISHVENRVLDRSETIGDTTYPAGTWVVGKKIHDEDLWQMVESGTLSGFSIGGTVTREQSYDDLPADVRESETVKESRDETGVTEIQDGVIKEISLVDMPAVPNATVQVAKTADSEKAAPELTESVEAATEFLVDQRGHTEQDASELAAFLNRHKQGDGSASWVSRAKAFFSGSDHGTDTEKAGATLSAKNRDSLMRIHDASLNVLHDAGYAPRRETFTDDAYSDFEMSTDRDVSQSADPAEPGREIDIKSMNDTEMEELVSRVSEKLESDTGDESDEADEEQSTEKAEQVEKLAGVVETLSDAVSELQDNQEKMLNAQGVSKQNSDPETEKSDYSGGFFDPHGGD